MIAIPFNKPFLTGKEAHYMYQAVYTGKLSGNGVFTKKCQKFFEDKYGFLKTLCTTSGTDALEMCAMLCDLKPEDEVIVPSYTFVSTALAFLREGAQVIFADSMSSNPNIDAEKLESLITSKTKVIVPVHYAGVSCDMDSIMAIAEKYNLFVVEDAAQAIDSYYVVRDNKIKSERIRELVKKYGNKLPLGGIGHLGAFSFHETKNITAGGEGGLLTINDERFTRRSEILWEKGTNRAEFFRGAVNKYGWVDMGSSFLPSEINSAFLWAQLEYLDEIQSKRRELWDQYFVSLQQLAASGRIRLPQIPDYATNNAHMFYIICRNLEERSGLIQYLKKNDIMAPFHYLSLHKSEYYSNHSVCIPKLPFCDMYADCLVRMPMFYELTLEKVDIISSYIYKYFQAFR
jgi:dTDP-4-amino-4,6-dideoxygalactose transaminase